MEDEVERLEEIGVTADKLFSRQGRTGWLYSGANSSWDCVHKIKPAKILIQMREGPMRPCP